MQKTLYNFDLGMPERSFSSPWGYTVEYQCTTRYYSILKLVFMADCSILDPQGVLYYILRKSSKQLELEEEYHSSVYSRWSEGKSFCAKARKIFGFQPHQKTRVFKSLIPHACLGKTSRGSILKSGVAQIKPPVQGYY